MAASWLISLASICSTTGDPFTCGTTGGPWGLCETHLSCMSRMRGFEAACLRMIKVVKAAQLAAPPQSQRHDLLPCCRVAVHKAVRAFHAMSYLSHVLSTCISLQQY